MLKYNHQPKAVVTNDNYENTHKREDRALSIRLSLHWQVKRVTVSPSRRISIVCKHIPHKIKYHYFKCDYFYWKYYFFNATAEQTKLLFPNIIILELVG